MWRPTATGVALTLVVAVGYTPAARSANSEPANAGRSTIVGEWVIRDVHQPVSFDFDPRGRIWFVDKEGGIVQVFDPRTEKSHRFYAVSDLVTDVEQGLVGIALDPGFPQEPYVYLFATRLVRGSPKDQIIRVTAGTGGSRPAEVIYSSAASPLHQHSGGRLVFGPDGMLYVVVGDATDPADAQDLGSTRGKILRLTPEGEAAPGNPFGSRVWAYGIRNSFGLAFDPVTGNLWETENGPECNDELNRIVRGRNYGWGPSAACGSATAPSDTNRDGLNPVMPMRWFTPTIAPTGAAFCEDCGLGPHSVDALFFGSFNTGELWRAELSNDRTSVRRCEVVATLGDLVLSLEVGPDGAIYYSTYLGIRRLVRMAA
jgi:glucose/arabinose dehydrogenase